MINIRKYAYSIPFLLLGIGLYLQFIEQVKDANNFTITAMFVIVLLSCVIFAITNYIDNSEEKP